MSISKYNSLNNALAAANRSATFTAIVHGCDGKFWVVRPVDAAKLEAAGYEWIR